MQQQTIVSQNRLIMKPPLWVKSIELLFYDGQQVEAVIAPVADVPAEVEKRSAEAVSPWQFHLATQHLPLHEIKGKEPN